MELFGRFDFDLTPDQEARAAALHEKAVVVDLMLQGPTGRRAFDAAMLGELQQVVRSSGPLHGLAHGIAQPVLSAVAGRLPAYQEAWRCSGLTAANLQLNVLDSTQLLEALSVRQAEVDAFDWMRKCRSAQDILDAKAAGGIGVFFNLQFVPVDVRDLAFFDVVARFGVRMVGLTYNTMNGIGAGCTERTDAGVSSFGAQVISRLEQLGVIVDVAHAGRQTTLDACALSSKPVVASHTCASGVYDVARAKSDEELRAVAGTGGVIGICALPFYLSAASDASIEVLLDHVDHVAATVGTSHVALGTDWPMQLPQWYMEEVFPAFAADMGFRPGDTAGAERTLRGFDDYRDYPNITRGLVARGYGDEDVFAMLGGNALRVFEACWG